MVKRKNTSAELLFTELRLLEINPNHFVFVPYRCNLAVKSVAPSPGTDVEMLDV